MSIAPMEEDWNVQRKEDAERSRKHKVLNEALATIENEGFDAVVLMGTYVTESGGTTTIKSNAGNYHAQTGMMLYEIRRREESASIEQRDTESPL